MKKRLLGKTGLWVSEIGFGGIPIQRISEQEVIPLVDALLENGINYIDTARGYSVSEAYLGNALMGRREQFILATKSMARSREAMARDIEASLTALRTGYIDLYQVHNPSVADFAVFNGSGGAVEALQEAKAQGKIGHLGITVHTKEAFRMALDLDWVETVMFPYNLVETQGEELITRCRERNIGFIAMKPLAGGAIDDARVALKFLLNNEAVSVVIPGMYSVAEVKENASVQAGEFTEEERKTAEQIRRRLDTIFCRRCGYCQPCPQGLAIPVLFTFHGYLKRYGLRDWAKPRYDGMEKKAGDCIECGVCETRCPYQLPIRELLKEVRKDFEA